MLSEVETLRQISAEALKEMMDGKVNFLLIDARQHESYDKEHLPGAVSIPSDHLDKSLLTGHRKTETIVTYCSSYECEASTTAANKLESYGYKNVLDYKGGIKEWKKQKHKTEK